MSRDTPDLSMISFRTEILFKGKPYGTPLYLISDALQLSSAFEKRCRRNFSSVSLKSRELRKRTLEVTGFRDINGKTKLRNALIHPSTIETEADRTNCTLHEINAMRALYYICLAENFSNLNTIECTFQMLNGIAKYYTARKENVESAWSFLSSPELHSATKLTEFRDRAIAAELHDLDGFLPYYEIFTDFSRSNVGLLSEQEDHVRSYGGQASNASVRYWQRNSFANDLRQLFWDYCRLLPTSGVRELLVELKTPELRNIILDLLDHQLQDKLHDSFPLICTRESSVRWQTNNWETAEYLSLYSDLMAMKTYHVCPMCGSVFEVPTRYKTKVYCDRHTHTQIQYFNRKRLK